ncbi:helix-turn-helix domain-containing protein [Pectobacterium carotovorum]|uniref:helix-turn-helix domain-containing protein n=1 Tax=Pectobacterium carotovorum TaxID=554 RepID=UPI0021F2DC6A|nr:helix-turn-helix domain-containing protein [Pectobacterium carotovorum]
MTDLNRKRRREYLRKTANDMRNEGVSIKDVADFLGVSKPQVRTLIQEYERFKTGGEA